MRAGRLVRTAGQFHTAGPARKEVTRVPSGESAVDRAAMATAASQVEQAVSVIQGLQSSMNGYVGQLQSGWQGQAASAFSGTYEAFTADFAKVLHALQSIQENLVSTHGTYQATEEANTSSVTRVAGLLNG
jgi:WXG100 family type VII secretion target